MCCSCSCTAACNPSIATDLDAVAAERWPDLLLARQLLGAAVDRLTGLPGAVTELEQLLDAQELFDDMIFELGLILGAVNA